MPTLGLSAKFPSPITAINLKLHNGCIIGNKKSLEGASPFNKVKRQPINAEESTPLGYFVSDMERVMGKGTLYLKGNNIITKELKKDESFRIPPEAWIAMTENINLQYVHPNEQRQRKGKGKEEENKILLEVQGPGTLWYDSLLGKC